MFLVQNIAVDSNLLYRSRHRQSMRIRTLQLPVKLLIKQIDLPGMQERPLQLVCETVLKPFKLS